MATDIHMNPATRNITGRFYYTLWYANAAGYSTKFLQAVQQSVAASAFPEVHQENVVVHTGGCYLLGNHFDFGSKKQSFDAVLFHSLRPDLKNQRCIYKATEFGNILHVTLLFFTEVQGCMASANPVKKGLLEEEYEEVFQRLVWMLLVDATARMGVEAIHVEKSERPNSAGEKKGASLCSLLGKK